MRKPDYWPLGVPYSDPERNGKKITNLEFTTVDDVVQVCPVFEDGTKGPWTNTGVNPSSSPESYREQLDDVYREKGLTPPKRDAESGR